MVDPNCDVEVGIHPGPFWYDPDKDLQVCSRHKHHYETSYDNYGPFNWTRGTRSIFKAEQKTSESEEVLQKAIGAIDNVLNVHENHLFPSDLAALLDAKERMTAMKNDFRILR